MFLAALSFQAIAGYDDVTNDALAHGQDTITFGRYLTSSEFGQAVMENWQSEFLAVGSMAILAVYLRQRGSNESKPVGAPHDATGVEG